MHGPRTDEEQMVNARSILLNGSFRSVSLNGTGGFFCAYCMIVHCHYIQLN